jgi:hypothetical protein
MIVDRMTVKAKRDTQLELAALLKSEGERLGWRARVYTSLCGGGKTNRVVMEVEYESLAAMEKAWADFRARPDTSTFVKKMNELSENEGSREFLELR